MIIPRMPAAFGPGWDVTALVAARGRGPPQFAHGRHGARTCVYARGTRRSTVREEYEDPWIARPCSPSRRGPSARMPHDCQSWSPPRCDTSSRPRSSCCATSCSRRTAGPGVSHERDVGATCTGTRGWSTAIENGADCHRGTRTPRRPARARAPRPRVRARARAYWCTGADSIHPRPLVTYATFARSDARYARKRRGRARARKLNETGSSPTPERPSSHALTPVLRNECRRAT